MIGKLRMFIASATLAAVIGLVTMSGPSYAVQGGGLNDTVKKIADLIKAKDDAGAKKLAADTVKKQKLEMDDIMLMFRPRNKGGMGIGDKALANPAKDGLEITLRDLGRDVPAGVAKQADALETSGYWIAAIAELAAARGWDKDSGKKTKKAWNEGSEEMRNLGIAFSKAAAGKGAQEIKSAAAKLIENCNRCHSIFKD